MRIRPVNDAPVRSGRAYVLYWMVAARRARANFALERAVELAIELGRPLIVFEPLRVGHPWASDRLHAFVLQGMADNARAFARTPARYFPYVEARPGEGRGLLEALAANAAVVVTDDAPVFFLPRMIAAAAGRLDVRLEAVDGNGLHPLRAVDRVFPTAFSFRAHLQKTLRRHLDDVPRPDPLAGVRLPSAPDAGDGAGTLAGAVAGAPHRCRRRAREPADRPRRRAGPGAGRGRSGAGPARGRSSTATWPPTPTTATTRTIRGPAACRRTCTSATCRRTRSSTR